MVVIYIHPYIVYVYVGDLQSVFKTCYKYSIPYLPPNPFDQSKVSGV